jgi:hypothetical protein
MSEATAVPEGSMTPQSLLAQMERLLAALDADLGRLDTDHRSEHRSDDPAAPGAVPTSADAGERQGRQQDQE